MSETIPPLLGVLLGLLGMVGSVLVKSGRFRSWERWYRDPAAPVWQRHVAFAYFPIGLGFLLAVLAGLLLDPDRPSPLGGVAAISAMVSFAWAGLSVLRPPEWAKPDWLKREEGRLEVNDSKFDRLFVMLVIGTCVAAAILMAALLLYR